jgi:hypothetical protein
MRSNGEEFLRNNVKKKVQTQHQAEIDKIKYEIQGRMKLNYSSLYKDIGVFTILELFRDAYHSLLPLSIR